MPQTALLSIAEGDIVTTREGRTFLVQTLGYDGNRAINELKGVALNQLVDLPPEGLERETQTVTGAIVESVADIFSNNAAILQRLWNSGVSREDLRTVSYALSRIGVLLVACDHPRFEPVLQHPPHHSERCTRCHLEAGEIRALATGVIDAGNSDDNPF